MGNRTQPPYACEIKHVPRRPIVHQARRVLEIPEKIA